MSSLVDNKIWKSRVLCIITGASRGFGESILEACVNSFTEFSKTSSCGKHRLHLVITARSLDCLDKLRNKYGFSNPSITMALVPGSIEDEQTLSSIQEVISRESRWDQAILIHNAGTLGDPTRLVADYDAKLMGDLNTFAAINITSFMALTGIFLKSTESVKSRIIVNISSLAAVSPLKGLSAYGSAKAARDAFMRSVSSECPDVLAFNYAPGALKTDMAKVLKETSHLKDFFAVESNILEPGISAGKLVKLLMNDSIKNGSHVDYFDDEVAPETNWTSCRITAGTLLCIHLTHWRASKKPHLDVRDYDPLVGCESCGCKSGFRYESPSHHDPDFDVHKPRIRTIQHLDTFCFLFFSSVWLLLSVVWKCEITIILSIQ